MDCGLFDKTVIPVVEANSTYFYVGHSGEALRSDQESGWEAGNGMKDYEVASLNMPPLEERNIPLPLYGCPSKWIKQGKDYILKLFTTKKYHLVFGKTD